MDQEHLFLIYGLYIPHFRRRSHRLLEKKGISCYPPFRPLYRTILRSFVSKAVPRQPSAPRDWTRRTWGCGCMNCRSLDAFLSNPSRDFFEFRRPSDERTHLQNRLGNEIRAGSLQASTIRSGSPHGLLVKTTKAYDDEVRAWRHRCSKINQIINSIGLPRLQAVLGAGYGSTMSLRPIPPETMRNPASSQVIDLTGNPTVSQADTPTAPRLNSASTPVSRLSQLDNSRAGITAGQASSTENTTRIQNVPASAILLPASNTPSG